MCKISAFILLFCTLTTDLYSQLDSCLLFNDAISEQCNDLILHSDGSFALFGTARRGTTLSSDIYIRKLDSIGQVNWLKFHSDEKEEIISHAVLTNENEYIFGGYNAWFHQRAFIRKVDINGNTLWNKELSFLRLYDLIKLDDSSIVMIGYKDISGRFGDFILEKRDKNGNHLWTKTFGTKKKDYGFTIESDGDGGFLLGGVFSGFHSPEGHNYKTKQVIGAVIKTDANGNEVWRKELGGIHHDHIKDIIKAPDGNTFIFGSTQSNGAGSYDFWLQKLDNTGQILWSKTYGGLSYELASSFTILDNEIYLLGTSNSFNDNENPDIYIVKTNLDGHEIWTKTVSSENSDYGYVIKASDKTCFIGGKSGKQSIFFKIDKHGLITTFEKPTTVSSDVSIKPNPTNEYAEITIHPKKNNTQFDFTLFDMNGHLIFSKSINGSSTSIDARKLAIGMYIYHIRDNNAKIFHGKLVVYH